MLQHYSQMSVSFRVTQEITNTGFSDSLGATYKTYMYVVKKRPELMQGAQEQVSSSAPVVPRVDKTIH